MSVDRAWLTDAVERVAWTFVQASIATGGAEAIAAAALDGEVSVLRAAAIGGIAALLSAVKAVAARRVGDPHSASTLFTASTPPSER